MTSAKQEINKKQRNTQVKTTDLRSKSSPMTDSLPVACCPSEQNFFSPTLFSFALYRFTLLCSGKGDNDDDDVKGDADFFSRTLFCFLALNRWQI
jgi:hypothetical protein